MVVIFEEAFFFIVIHNYKQIMKKLIYLVYEIYARHIV